MALYDYPFDIQNLRAFMIPFGNTSEEVVLRSMNATEKQRKLCETRIDGKRCWMGFPESQHGRRLYTDSTA